jgi:hypothetical protein
MLPYLSVRDFLPLEFRHRPDSRHSCASNYGALQTSLENTANRKSCSSCELDIPMPGLIEVSLQLVKKYNGNTGVASKWFPPSLHSIAYMYW